MTYETVPLKLGLTAIYITYDEIAEDDIHYDDEEIF